jgi:23S rRNA (uracil1939-C5)-methyltransferase
MIELHPHDMAHGGEAVARHDGKAYFIPGAMPGEVVEATVVDDKGSWARTALVEVIVASPERRTPPCPYARDCGGCQWQFASEEVQQRWKRDTVVGQLEHLGKITDPVVHETVVPSSEFGYRNRMDFRVAEGKPALFRSRCQAAISSARRRPLSILRARHCRPSTLNSHSAMFNQLPCLGV